MNPQIIEIENTLIKDQIKDTEIRISILQSKKQKLDFNSSFTDSLNKHFYGGMVGYMSKKDNAKKSRELEKYINTCNSEKQLNEGILRAEKELKKLLTGNYLIRKNGLIVESYKLLIDKKESINKMLLTGEIKGNKATKEELNILSDLKKENLKQIKQREKLLKNELV